MEWTIALDEVNHYAEIVTGGLADRNGSLEMAKDISRVLAPAQIKKILIDHRNIKAVSGGTALSINGGSHGAIALNIVSVVADIQSN